MFQDNYKVNEYVVAGPSLYAKQSVPSNLTAITQYFKAIKAEPIKKAEPVLVKEEVPFGAHQFF